MLIQLAAYAFGFTLYTALSYILFKHLLEKRLASKPYFFKHSVRRIMHPGMSYHSKRLKTIEKKLDIKIEDDEDDIFSYGWD